MDFSEKLQSLRKTKGLTQEDSMFCKHCGSQIDVDSKFCNKCGKEQ